MSEFIDYHVKVVTPSLCVFPEVAIRDALADYPGLSIAITEQSGSTRPRLESITFPENAKLAKAYIGSREIPEFGQQAMAHSIQSILTRMRSKT